MTNDKISQDPSISIPDPSLPDPNLPHPNVVPNPNAAPIVSSPTATSPTTTSNGTGSINAIPGGSITINGVPVSIPTIYYYNYGTWTNVDPGIAPTITTKETDPPTVILNTGCHCKRCNDFNEFAEPNQEDNTFVCYKCRHNY